MCAEIVRIPLPEGFGEVDSGTIRGGLPFAGLAQRCADSALAADRTQAIAHELTPPNARPSKELLQGEIQASTCYERAYK